MKRKKTKHSIAEIVKRELNKEVIIRENAENKISEAILKLAEPLLEECNNDAEYRKAISFSVTIWNLCTMSTEEKCSFINKLLDDSTDSPDGKLFLQNLINRFIERKMQLYPHDHRYVVDYFIKKISGKRNLTVAAIAQ